MSVCRPLRVCGTGRVIRFSLKRFVERLAEGVENLLRVEAGAAVGPDDLERALRHLRGVAELDRAGEARHERRVLGGCLDGAILKGRNGHFRAWDHQLMQEMYTMSPKPRGKAAWDFLALSEPVPGASDKLEALAPTQEENACKMA